MRKKNEEKEALKTVSSDTYTPSDATLKLRCLDLVKSPGNTDVKNLIGNATLLYEWVKS